MSKGSKQRPRTVSKQTFDDNWDRIFSDPKNRDDAIAEDEAFSRVQKEKANKSVWANRNVWNDPELSKQDRLANEIESIKNMKDTRTEGEKQAAAWLKDEYYDIDEDKPIGC